MITTFFFFFWGGGGCGGVGGGVGWGVSGVCVCVVLQCGLPSNHWTHLDMQSWQFIKACRTVGRLWITMNFKSETCEICKLPFKISIEIFCECVMWKQFFHGCVGSGVCNGTLIPTIAHLLTCSPDRLSWPAGQWDDFEKNYEFQVRMW